MGISWGAISGAFIGPFFYGLYWKKTTKASVYASFIVGITIAVVGLVLSLAGDNAKITSVSAGFKICWFDFADSIYMGVAAMVLSFIIVPVVSSFTKKPENVNDIFRCYSQKVVVTSDVALTEKEETSPEDKISEQEAAEERASYSEND